MLDEGCWVVVLKAMSVPKIGHWSVRSMKLEDKKRNKVVINGNKLSGEFFAPKKLDNLPTCQLSQSYFLNNQ
ncbi:MAG: hypothetical protein DSY77_13405 [Bacteroidetes bacterium]|nr:MAG: hypothetical protein DSY77_13405 [Bacteroidota bacterium]